MKGKRKPRRRKGRRGEGRENRRRVKVGGGNKVVEGDKVDQVEKGKRRENRKFGT